MKCLEYEHSNWVALWFCLTKARDLAMEMLDIEHYHRYVQKIAVPYATGNEKPFDPVREFPARWPRMEYQILACYRNTERIRLNHRVDVTFSLVRRSCKATTERVLDYKSVLAQHRAKNPEKYDVTDIHNGMVLPVTLEQLCDALILSNSRWQQG